MNIEFKPNSISHSKVLDRPGTATGGGKGRIPTIPGSGQGFRPERQPAPRKSHKLAKGLGLASAAAVGGTAVYIGTQDGTESSTDNTAAVTTVEITQPPLTSPDTTVITITPTTEVPTTVAERVFASPEQESEVLAVEANMADFFELTPNDLELYKNQATFTPYPEGFAPITDYAGSSIFRALVINLGTFTSIGDSGQATIHMFGVMKEDGTRFVAAETLVVTGPEIAGEQFSELTGGRQVNIMNPVRNREYGTTSAFDLDTLLDHRVTMSEAISLLDSNPGLPMTIDVAADSAWLNSLGAPTVANPEMKLIFEEIFELGSGEHMRAALDKYSTEELAAIGILKAPVKLPQEMLTHTSAGQLLSTYPWNGLFTLFNNLPPISFT